MPDSVNPITSNSPQLTSTKKAEVIATHRLKYLAQLNSDRRNPRGLFRQRAKMRPSPSSRTNRKDRRHVAKEATTKRNTVCPHITLVSLVTLVQYAALMRLGTSLIDSYQSAFDRINRRCLHIHHATFD